MTNIQRIAKMIRQLTPANVHKVLVYATTLKEMQDSQNMPE